MKCKICGTQYDDEASYCNNCDVPLVDENGTSLEVNKTVASEPMVPPPLHQNLI